MSKLSNEDTTLLRVNVRTVFVYTESNFIVN